MLGEGVACACGEGCVVPSAFAFVGHAVSDGCSEGSGEVFSEVFFVVECGFEIPAVVVKGVVDSVVGGEGCVESGVGDGFSDGNDHFLVGGGSSVWIGVFGVGNAEIYDFKGGVVGEIPVDF